MSAHTGNTLVAEARDALEVGKTVKLLLQGHPDWFLVEVLGGLSSDVGTLQAKIRGGARLVFRKDSLIAVHITDD